MLFFLNWGWPQKPPISQLLRVMKLTIILLTTALLQVSAKGISQKVTYIGKDVTLQTVFNTIKQQSGYTVFCNADILSDAGKVSVKIKNATIEEAMEKTLKGQPLTYNIIGKTIVVKNKPQEPKVDPNDGTSAMDANIDVHGRIVNEKGEPVAGVTVTVKGTKKATAANANGEFILKDVDENAVLVLTSVNAETREIKVNGKSDLGELVVKQKFGTGEEIIVQVNTGYQTLPKERATGSYDIIGADKIERRIFTNVKDALEGQAPGLSTFKGDMVIRGVSTFAPEIGNQPLIVIDGLPTEKNIDDINMNDVASFTILKDAAAASIYGVRASNGVIVITTKGGKFSTQNKTSVQFTMDYRWIQNPSLSDYHYATTGDIIAYQLANISRETVRRNFPTELAYLENSLKGIGEAGSRSTNLTYFDPLQNARLEYLRGNLSQQDYNALLSKWSATDYRKEYMKQVWKTPLRKSYNLSINSSGKNQSTYASLNYIDDGQQIRFEKSQYIKGYLKSSQRLNKWFSIDLGTDIQYNHRVNVNSSYDDFNSLEPYTSILDENGNKVYRDYVDIIGMQRGLHVNPKILSQIQGLQQFESYKFNILDELNDNLIKQDYYNVRSFASFNFNIGRHIRFSTSGMYEFAKNKSEEYRSKESYYYRFLRNSYASYEPINSIIPQGGMYSSTENSGNSWVWRNQLDFDKKFGSDHEVNATAGVELRQIKTGMSTNAIYFGYDPVALTYTTLNDNYIYNIGYEQSYIYNNNTGPGAVLDGDGVRLRESNMQPTLSEVTNRYVGAYAVAGYTYKGKYALSGSVRVDQTNLFGTDPKYRYRPLWSAGLKWNASKEDFMQNISWVDMLDLRMSYGLTGNVDQTTTPYLVARLGNQSTYTADAVPYATIYTAPNPLLRWEKTASYNVGIDYSLLKGMLNGKLDVYYRKSDDLLGEREVNYTSGYATQRINSGAMANKGFELYVSSPWYSTKDLLVTTTLSFAYNKNKVLKAYYKPISASNLAISGYLVDGKPFDALYAYRYGGLTSGGTEEQNGVPIIYRADGTTFHHFETNGSLSLDRSSSMLPEDVVYMGTKTPPISASLTQNIRYKGFELSAMFLYYGGHKMYLPSYGFVITDGNDDWSSKAWRPDNTGSDIPKSKIYYNPGVSVVSLGSLEDMYIRSTKNVAKGDFIRLRNIALSYTLPDKIGQKLKMNRFKITAQINNPWIWSAAGKQYDSEVQTSQSNTMSLRSWGLPMPTTYLLRLDVLF